MANPTECIHCKEFWTCKDKKNKAEQCLNFKEESEEDGRCEVDKNCD